MATKRIKVGDRIVHQGRHWEIYRISIRFTNRCRGNGEPLYHLRKKYPKGNGKGTAWTYSACDIFSVSKLEPKT